jgi:hypothetical protein
MSTHFNTHTRTHPRVFPDATRMSTVAAQGLSAVSRGARLGLGTVPQPGSVEQLLLAASAATAAAAEVKYK